MYTRAIAVLFTLYVYNVSGSHYHGPLAKPTVLKSGYLADTNEVAAAKVAHLQTLAKQTQGHVSDYGYGESYKYSRDRDHSNSYGGHEYLGYHGPTAIPHVLRDGHIADTHEVAAAKAEHFAAVSNARGDGGYGHEYSGRFTGDYGADHSAHNGYSHHTAPFNGPLAKPVVLKSGYLAVTHEVTAAREHHLAAVHKADYNGHHDHEY